MEGYEFCMWSHKCTATWCTTLQGVHGLYFGRLCYCFRVCVRVCVGVLTVCVYVYVHMWIMVGPH